MKPTRLSVFLLLLALFITGINKIQAQAAKNYFNTGFDLYKKNQYDQAIQYLDKAIKADPDYLAAYQVRGNSFFALKEYDLALDDYDDAIDIEPRNGINYYNRGNAFNAIKLYDSAMMDYNKALDLKPNYAYGYLARGILHNNLRERELALQDFNNAILFDSTLLNAYNSRGLTYLFKGDYESAVNDFKKSIALDVNREKPYAMVNIIEPLARLYRFSEAADYYNTFRAKYATGFIDNAGWQFFKKYIEVVTQNLTKNDYTGALANLTQAEKLYSSKTVTDDDFQRRGFSSLLALKGFVYEKLNQNDNAKHAYEQTLLINPSQPDIPVALQRLSQKNQALVQNDNTPPVITILEPQSNNRSISVEDDKTAGTHQRIRGRAIDPSGIRSVLINNRFLKVEENGYFDTVVNINEGVNVFTVVVTDNHANAASENIQIVGGKDRTNAAAENKPVNTVINYNPVYHAVLIAETDYADKNISSLKGPLTDMQKIYNLLVANYFFAPENTDTLVNASKTTILESIIKKANAMEENDNLFIFYAGHGEMIKQPDNSEEGFLVPQDAARGKLSSYISSDDLLRTIKYSKAKHILFVADACFAGSLFRDIEKDAPAPVAEAYKDQSRKLLASGNRTAVPDQSEFIEYLRLALQENKEKYITAEQLIDTFKNQYRTTTHLSLQYFPIKNVDDFGGQFVFKRK
jgi:tetratricopeptide (TPR) repeat protein